MIKEVQQMWRTHMNVHGVAEDIRETINKNIENNLSKANSIFSTILSRIGNKFYKIIKWRQH